MTRLFRARWNLLRLAVALFLLWTLAVDSAARTARLELASLPDFDFAAHARLLREQGRFAEAVTTADAGLTLISDPAAHTAIEHERGAAIADQGSWLRRARDLGLGALTGPGNTPDDSYTTLERIAGALAADFFVVGDVRDLILQGLAAAQGRDTDPLIIALSAVGIATTLAPEIDWAPSLLKSARSLGTLSRRLSDFLLDAARTRNLDALRPFFADLHTLARRASPAGAARLLRLADDPAQVAHLARFVERRGPAGAAALHFGGQPAAQLLYRAADNPAELARAENLLLRAARKGPASERFLSHSAARRSLHVLTRAHPLVGLAKGLYKGEVAALIQRAVESLDNAAWWILGLLAAWTTLELALLCRKLAPTR